MFEADRDRIRQLGRIAGTGLQLHEHLRQRPITNAVEAAAATGINRTSITNALAAMEKLGIVRELTGQKRNRLFTYDRYLNILAEGTEPID